MRVLVLAEKESCALLAAVLARAGHAVTTGTWPDGPVLAVDAAPEVVLLGPSGPSFPAVHVCATVRRSPELQRAVVVSIDASCDPGFRIAAIQAGADAVAPEPLQAIAIAARMAVGAHAPVAHALDAATDDAALSPVDRHAISNYLLTAQLTLDMVLQSLDDQVAAAQLERARDALTSVAELLSRN